MRGFVLRWQIAECDEHKTREHSASQSPSNKYLVQHSDYSSWLQRKFAVVILFTVLYLQRPCFHDEIGFLSWIVYIAIRLFCSCSIHFCAIFLVLAELEIDIFGGQAL